VLIGVNEDAQVYSMHGGISPHDLDLTLKVGRLGRQMGRFHGRCGALQPVDDLVLVMEYVAGVPITDYCDKHKLTTQRRLELFVDVCEGVQHAHQKAILHRDLKPSNILVVEVDGKPIPKIIDFGVAKATSQRLTDATMFTQLGAVIGTPAYMSPEQANSFGMDVIRLAWCCMNCW